MTILLIDADVATLRLLGGRLEEAGFEVARELDPSAGLAAFDRLAPDVVVAARSLPELEGESVLELFKRRGVPVIAIVDDSEARHEALRGGAEQALVRPPDPELLVAAAHSAARASRLRQVTGLLAAGSFDGRFDGIGGQPPMRDVAHLVDELARTDRTPVLITGEPGVGRTYLARSIHELSPRRAEPFLSLTIPGQPLAELEARLAGYESGSRPGAGRRLRGLFELAGEGSVLLREVGALPSELQPVVLRVLEQRAVRRIGGSRDVPVRARVLASTSEDLSAAVDAGRFSSDLFYRLGTATIAVPPVRERAESDRLALIETIHRRLAGRLGQPGAPIASEAVRRLLEYGWPGNVAEMEHVLERAALLARGQPAILIEHLPGEFRARPGLGDRRHNPMSLDEVERRQIESALRFHGGNRTRAAKELRISRATLINKIKRYGITE